MKDTNPSRFFWMTLLLLAFCGFLALFLSPQELGAGPDSFAFVSAARSYLAGSGFRNVTWDGQTELLTHFPPLYSFLLAKFGFENDPIQNAKLLNAAVFMANIFLIGLIIRQISNYNWLALVGATIFLTSDIVIQTHCNICTEPLFIFLTLAALCCFSLFVKNKKPSALLLTAILVGLGAITRYVGVTVIGTTALTLLLLPYAEKRKRFYNAVVFTAVSATPLMIWLIRNALIANSATNRTITFHLIRGSKLLDALYTFGLWVLPGIQITVLAGIIFLFLLVAAFLAQHRFTRPMPASLVWSGVFILVYCGFLLFSISFIDAHTSLSTRILFPVYVISLIFLLSGLAAVLPRIKEIPFVRVLPLGACLVYLILNVMAGSRTLNTIYSYGLGYLSGSWQQSELMEQLYLLADDDPIYTNVPDAVYFARNEVVAGVPIKEFATSQLKNEAYFSELDSMFEKMASENAKVVYFNRISRWYVPTEEELSQNAAFSKIYENDEGAIYAFVDPLSNE